MKALFLVAGYITILLSANYIEEGDYYQGEYYFLLLSAILGMTVMASARDLVTIFVALETISIPTYLLAGWRKHDAKSNEASLKYYLMGVLSSAVMLYGMSIVYGLAGDTRLVEIAKYVEHRRRRPAVRRGHLLHPGRLRLQGVGRALPLLGARLLRGRADPGDGLPVGGVEDRRVRGPAEPRLRRLLRPGRRLAADPVGAGRGCR